MEQSRVMVVAAHPDDAEFGCGGTVAKWIKQGAEAMFVIATHGDKGDDQAKLSPLQVADVRKGEQLKAAAIIGAQQVEFLGCEDGMVQVNDALRGSIVELIRRFKPQVVITHDPSSVFAASCGVNHSDHRNLGLAAVDAVYPYARGAHQYPEQIASGLEPHVVEQILVWDCEKPDHWEDVTETFNHKIDALLAHESQYADADKIKAFVEANLTVFGTGSRRQFAEAFRRIVFQ